MITLLVIYWNIIISKIIIKWAIDLSKPQALDADAKAMKQINFVGNLNQGDNANDNTTTFFIAEEAKEIILDFSQGTMEVSSYFVLL